MHPAPKGCTDAPFCRKADGRSAAMLQGENPLELPGARTLRRARKAPRRRPRGGHVPSDRADRADARRYHIDATVMDMIAVMAHMIASKCYARPTYPDVLSHLTRPGRMCGARPGPMAHMDAAMGTHDRGRGAHGRERDGQDRGCGAHDRGCLAHDRGYGAQDRGHGPHGRADTLGACKRRWRTWTRLWLDFEKWGC